MNIWIEKRKDGYWVCQPGWRDDVLAIGPFRWRWYANIMKLLT